MSLRQKTETESAGITKPLVLLLMLLCACGNVWALNSDRKKPVKVSADKVDVNQKNGVTRYSGNVKLIQGTLQINADEIVVRYRAGNIETVSATGTPVTLRQRLDRQSEDIVASAARLHYHALENKVDLFDRVAVRRGGDELHSEVAHYDIEKEQLSARGETPETRVYTILQPTKPPQSPSPKNTDNP